MEPVQLFLQSILDSLNSTDQSWLLGINSCNSPFWDSFMFWISDKWIWIPMYLSIFYAIIKDKRQETFFIAVCVALTVLACDQFSSGLCKPLFERFRPCQDPVIGASVHTVCGVKCDLYGFISSHAANTVGVAMFTTLLIKNKLYSFCIWLWALLNCYSRMYMGLHYPGDIICGALSGMLFGWLFFLLYSKVLLSRMPQFRYIHHRTNSRSNIDFPTSDILPFVWTFCATIFIIIIFASNRIFTC